MYTTVLLLLCCLRALLLLSAPVILMMKQLPTDIPETIQQRASNLHLFAARSTCATKDVTRWFSRWWSGSIVSTPTPQGCCGSLYTVYIQNRLSCGVAPFPFKSTKEDPVVVVSAMACHLPAGTPVGTTGASLMISSTTVAA